MKNPIKITLQKWTDKQALENVVHQIGGFFQNTGKNWLSYSTAEDLA
jgi:hypothetical protein